MAGAIAGGAVLGLVGLGAVAGAVKIARGVRAGKLAARAAPKLARAAKACSRMSFEAGTLVTMADGSEVPIEDLRTGDLVLTSDPLTEELSAQPVLAPLTTTGTKHLFVLSLEGSEEPITVTANHPIWVEGDGWTEVEDLHVAQLVRTSGSTIARLTTVTDLGTFDDRPQPFCSEHAHVFRWRIGTSRPQLPA